MGGSHATIETLIQELIDDPDELEFLRELARKHHGLVIDTGWTGWHLLRADGAVVFVDDEHPQDPPRAETDERRRISALCMGAHRWPELRPLLPTRTSEPDCPHCDARGFLALPSKDQRARPIVCGGCGGLGWVHEESTRTARGLQGEP